MAVYTERTAGTLISDYPTLIGTPSGTLSSGIQTAIGNGNRFKITYTETSTNLRISVLLLIDNLCRLEFRMGGQYQKVNNEWRMHDIVIERPDCYKCTTCGLCGTFNTADWTMPQCNGESFSFQVGTFWYDNYDSNGWTWEQNWVEQKCEGIPSNPQEPPYTPVLPPEPQIDTCDPEIKVELGINCQNIFDLLLELIIYCIDLRRFDATLAFGHS